MMRTMKLTAEQTEDLPFPVGCPVWYNFPEQSSSTSEDEEKGDNGREEPPILKQGVVKSVAFNYGAKDLIYEVVYNDGDNQRENIVEEVSEHNLAYGSGCPVTVDFDGDGSSLAVEEGTVLLCDPLSSNPSKIRYTAMISMEGDRARYEFGIDAERVRYRKVNSHVEVAVLEQVHAPAAVSPSKERPTTAATKGSDLPAVAKVSVLDTTVHHKNETVPSSITCDSIAQNSGEVGGTRSDNKRMRGPDADSSPRTSPPKKNPRVGAAATDTPHNNAHNTSESRGSIASHGQVGSAASNTLTGQFQPKNRIDIELPLWLQRDLPSRKKLYYHLVGSRRDKIRGTEDIGRETNCQIMVNFDPRVTVPQPPMSITVIARSKFPVRDLANAGKDIEELMLNYALIRNDGSKIRLLYEMAASYRGAHRPSRSISRAVNVRNPFDDHRFQMLSVVDLPFEVHNGKRRFHVSYLLKFHILDNIRREGCRIETFGNRNECQHQTRFCDPYVLVIGDTMQWQGVDFAVDILKDAIRQEIRRHKDK
mmetsp:Transcript_12268/g.29998  ORF Transcript_12268/g.29998 Transcript_12268/m.29998 type:complete len:535 (-) Transcript_12268:336-1940(-)